MSVSGFFKDLANSVQLMSFRSKRVTFYRDWAKAIQAKELLGTFLRAELAISSAKATADDSRAYALKQMLQRMQTGDEMKPSQVVGLTMPKSDMLMLMAGDNVEEKHFSGVLEDLCRALEEQAMAKTLLVKAGITPLLLLPGMAAFAYVLSSKAIPIIEQVAPPEVWTPLNNAVRLTANALNDFGLYFVIFVIALAISIAVSLPRWTGKARFKFEKMRPKTALMLFPVMPWVLPMIIYRDFQALMVFSSLAVLLQSGATLNDALANIASRSNPYMRRHLRRTLDYLDLYPLEVAQAFTNLLSPQVSARLASISRTEKAYEKVLIQVGTTGAVAIREQVGKSAKGMNFLLMGVAGSLIMFLYIGMQTITQSMKNELDPSTMQQRKMEKEQNYVR
jgi:type II secretory pathway component PulF